MKNKYRNLFLGFGIIAVVVCFSLSMCLNDELWSSLKRVGYTTDPKIGNSKK